MSSTHPVPQDSSLHHDMHHEDMLQLGTFVLGNSLYAVDLLKFREIIRMQPVTKVPRAEGCMEGVLNLRGSIIPIVNLRKRFDMPAIAYTSETRIVNMDLENMIVGFIVDKIGAICRVRESSVGPLPPVAEAVSTEFLTGVVMVEGQMIIILDVNKIIDKDVLSAMSQDVQY